MPSIRHPGISIEPMTAADWPEVRRIYVEGIATGDATLEREAPDWSHFDRSHPAECRLVARDRRGRPSSAGRRSGGYSARKVYAGVAWESVYVGEATRGRGVGRALLEALIVGFRGGRVLDALRWGPGRERNEASPSTNASGSGGSASSAGSVRTLTDAGGTSSSSNVGARPSEPAERSATDLPS